MTEENNDPYYAVIFTSIISEETEGYAEMADKMVEIAREVDGFMGIDSAREEQGITISYWKNMEAISKWKNDSQHLMAQKLGKEKWYKHYSVRIAKVLKEYEFNKM